jgi:ubiquinone/menaquinone biosynthesis C-methylase UbiE
MRAPYSGEPGDPKAFQEGFDRFYSRTARLYDMAVKALPVWKTWLGRALPHIAGRRVLEISFGTGYLMTRYAGKHETHGIDINGRMVAVAAQNLRNKGLPARLVQGSVEGLPYEDAAFDAVVNTMALTGYPDGAQALSEIERVLRPGGLLILMDVNYPKNRNWLGTGLTRLWQNAGDIIRDVDSLLADHGFDFEDVEIGGFGSIHLYLCRKG